ncbi:hypothetical protein B0H14DRAFT_2627117 [Mycena olivaceomarginata]|nr:hypothetical protein B0H14DRAFT_2636658 [Mycena olivaceomarginata]KAJ7789589.1 hypothetical protein B0H14DRAFT_2627117 [Mycena olivaceomarginata]
MIILPNVAHSGLAVVSVRAANANYWAFFSALLRHASVLQSSSPLSNVPHFDVSLVKKYIAVSQGAYGFWPFYLYLIKYSPTAAVVPKLRFTPNVGALMRRDDVVEQYKMWDARVMRLAVRYVMYWFLTGTTNLPALSPRKTVAIGSADGDSEVHFAGRTRAVT